MRYTTIVDISQIPNLYKNQNVRLIYLHLVLRAGYHDDDRDQTTISFRRIAEETGLTLSATRHAISLLIKNGLLTRNGGIWIVKKFVLEKSISSRPKTAKKQKEMESLERERQIQEEQRERERAQKRRYQEERKKGNPLKQMVMELMLQADAGDEEARKQLTMYKNVVEEIKKEHK